MIPIDREVREEARRMQGFAVMFICGLAALIIIAAAAGWWFITTEPERRENYVHAMATLELRAQDQTRLEKVYEISNAVARHNPLLTMAERYEIATAVEGWSEFFGVDPMLVLAVLIVESHADPYAVSKDGAIGLMQVMPDEWGVSPGELYVIDTNVRWGAGILAYNIRRWGTEEGVARYFWGTGKEPDGTYLAKVLKAREGLGG